MIATFSHYNAHSRRNHHYIAQAYEHIDDDYSKMWEWWLYRGRSSVMDGKANSEENALLAAFRESKKDNARKEKT